MFHDGTPVTASAVVQVLLQTLPDYIGPAFKDIDHIDVLSESELEIVLRRPSTFVLEGLDVPIYRGEPSHPIGTGPFYDADWSDDRVEMVANNGYYEGSPLIDRLVVTPYSSVRSAWADLLRGEVDMLYEVGVDAVDLLEPSKEVRIFSFLRPYASMVILNVRKPQLRDAGFRRALNAAVDRQSIVKEALNGHGAPAEGPVWPRHWSYDHSLPRFLYGPRAVGETSAAPRFALLYTEPSHERVALMLQRQLRAVGVDVALEIAPLDQALARVRSGDFDAFLADAVQGPALLRPYWFWYSESPYNWGGFSSKAVDTALDAVRDARDDKAYKTGVAAFQRAIIDDPPAIFLAWSERARAVSTRFEIPPAEAGHDILQTLRLWRPRSDTEVMSRN